jgi:hypothetical protein
LVSVRGTIERISSDGDQEEIEEKSYPSPDAALRKKANKDENSISEKEVEGISRKIAKDLISTRFAAL